MARARIVAVVVPSPATSLVLLATTLTSFAPMFSNGSGSSISFETVTPSLVTVGPPNDLDKITLRPVGPRVVPTAWARISTPSSILRRAASEKSSCLGTCAVSSRELSVIGRRLSVGHHRSSVISLPSTDDRRPITENSLHDLRQDVGLAEDLDLLALDLDVGAGVLAEEDLVPFLDADRGALAGIEQL